MSIDMVQEDPIVYKLPPGLTSNLGTRFLVSGVDGNDPEKPNIIVFLRWLFVRVVPKSSTSCIHHKHDF
jgi:hypothetical protein